MTTKSTTRRNKVHVTSANGVSWAYCTVKKCEWLGPERYYWLTAQGDQVRHSHYVGPRDD